jgi:hypothetical protein
VRHDGRVSISRALLVLVALCALGGCATVQPWERATLSHPCMELSPRLGDGFRAHILPIREGALPGGAGLGGGCGCG